MSFTGDMTAFCKDVAPAYLDNVIRRCVIEIGSRVVMRSPVGNPAKWAQPERAPPGYAGGAFRRNWQYGYGTPETGTVDGIDPSGGNTINAITAEAIASKAVGVHYITNNLPYAERLENGWSNQAPQGIVSLTELEFPEIFNRAKNA